MSEPMTTTTNSVPKAALITGGSRGIGAACARLFARQGYGVGIVCQKAKDRAEALAEELAALGVPVKVYVCDVAQREQVQAMTAKVFVPAHTEVTEDIADLAQYNIRKVHEIAERIVDLCAAPRGFEDILQQLFAAYGLTMSFEQYVLVGSTVRSYLAWLKDTGRLTALFEDGWMRWARV